MNERIKELWSQAHKRGGIIGIEEIDKFAELIIRECGLQVSNSRKMYWKDAVELKNEILESFGIVEANDETVD